MYCNGWDYGRLHRKAAVIVNDIGDGAMNRDNGETRNVRGRYRASEMGYFCSLWLMVCDFQRSQISMWKCGGIDVVGNVRNGKNNAWFRNDGKKLDCCAS